MTAWREIIMFPLIKFVLATAAAVAFEYCWLNIRQLLGYLWLINTYRADANDVEDIYKYVRGTYSIPVSAAVNALCVIVVWTVGNILKVVEPNCAYDILKNTFWLSALFYTLNLPIMICSNTHWQPYLHGHVNGFFKYFFISSLIYMHAGDRLLKWFNKPAEKKKIE